MKPKGMKGMRDIPTIQGLRNQSLPKSRELIVAEVARMEHEKARLERELRMWVSNEKKTENRLQRVEERLGLLQQMLEPPPASAPKRAKNRRAPVETTPSGESQAQGWQEVSLKY
jgi:hypothetical protein